MTSPTLSRRAFLRLAALGGIGIGIAIIQRNTAHLGAWNFIRWVLRAQLKRLSPAAVVGLGQCSSYSDNILDCLRQVWMEAEMPDLRGKRILVKPNLLDVVEGYPATTAPQVVAAVLDLLAEMGVDEVTVGDGSAFRRDTYSVVESCGLSQLLNARGVPFIDLNYDDPQPVPVRDGWIKSSDRLWLPQHVLQADYVISMPKLKTHHWTGVTLGLKNLLGVLPGGRYGWPKNMIHINAINATILGVYQVMPPVLSVVDGIVGMEGNGPMFGSPVQHGLLAVGSDAVAVDVVCAQLMGFALEEIAHLSVASWAGIGQTARIETRGADFSGLMRIYQRPPPL